MNDDDDDGHDGDGDDEDGDDDDGDDDDGDDSADDDEDGGDDAEDDDEDNDGAGCLHIFKQHMACATSHDIISLQCIITWHHSHSGFVDPSCF